MVWQEAHRAVWCKQGRQLRRWGRGQRAAGRLAPNKLGKGPERIAAAAVLAVDGTSWRAGVLPRAKARVNANNRCADGHVAICDAVVVFRRGHHVLDQGWQDVCLLRILINKVDGCGGRDGGRVVDRQDVEPPRGKEVVCLTAAVNHAPLEGDRPIKVRVGAEPDQRLWSHGEELGWVDAEPLARLVRARLQPPVCVVHGLNLNARGKHSLLLWALRAADGEGVVEEHVAQVHGAHALAQPAVVLVHRRQRNVRQQARRGLELGNTRLKRGHAERVGRVKARVLLIRAAVKDGAAHNTHHAAQGRVDGGGVLKLAHSVKLDLKPLNHHITRGRGWSSGARRGRG